MIVVAVLLTLVVGFIAVLHAYWGMGGLWPARDEATLARTVVGDGRTRMPDVSLCFAVAILLLVVAAWPWAVLAYPDNSLVVAGLMVIVAVFLLRALAPFSPRWQAIFRAEPFATNDRRFYAPLCFTLSAGYAVMMEAT